MSNLVNFHGRWIPEEDAKRAQANIDKLNNREQSVLRESAYFENTNNRIAEDTRKENLIKSHAIAMESTKRFRRGKSIGALIEKTQSSVLETVLFDIFFESLVLDTEFKTKHTNDLAKIIENYVSMVGGVSHLSKISNNIFAKRLAEGCEKISSKVYTRIVKESNKEDASDTESDINFELTEDEQNTLEDVKDNLSVEEISDVVKQKVVDVVKDEQEKEEKNKELMDAIEDELANDDNVVDEQTATESFRKLVIGKTYRQESMFGALFKDCLRESVAVVSNKDDDNTIVPRLSQQAIAKSEELVSQEIDDTDMTDLGVDDDGTLDKHIDMDMVLAETITKYTFLEMLHTLGLENFESVDEARKFFNKVTK